MGKEIVRKGQMPGQLDEFYQAHEMVVRGMRSQVQGYFEMGVGLKQIRDNKLFERAGYSTFGDYLGDRFELAERQIYNYIEVVEKLPQAVLQRVAEMAKPISLRQLTTLQIGQGDFTDEEVDRLVGLSDEEFSEELVKMGYDRAKMGGRGPSDLKRTLVSRQTYRSQRQKMQAMSAELDASEAEKAELAEEMKGLKGRLDQLIEAMKDPKAKAVVLELDKLRAENIELRRKEAEAEAEIATGKMVGARALALIGEQAALLGAFERGVRIDTKAQWMEVRACLRTMEESVDQCLGRMAETIIERMEAQEIKHFNVEDPEGDGLTAQMGLRKPGEPK